MEVKDGGSISYAFGPKSSSSSEEKRPRPEPCNSLVGDWLTQPAVRLPQVLAISDQSIIGIDGTVPISDEIPCFELFAEGDSLLTVVIPAGLAIQSTFTVIEPNNPTASVTIRMFDESGILLFNSGRALQGTYPIPAGINPADVRTLTFENGGEFFQFTAIICGI